MKFELKTDKDYPPKIVYSIFIVFAIVFLGVIVSNISLKLGNISRNYQINYLCRLLTIDTSSSNFNKLSKILSTNSKQSIWEFCRDFVK